MFSAIISKGDNFCDTLDCFVLCQNPSSGCVCLGMRGGVDRGWATLKERSLLSEVLIPFEKGGKT